MRPKGFRHTEITKKRISEASLGKKNGMWKGDDVGIKSLHDWVRRNKPKPEFCESCHKNPPFDAANISQEYKRDLNDFEWLCRTCHMTKDGRLKKMSKLRW